MSLALRVHDLGKRYRLGTQIDAYATLRDLLADAVSASFRRSKRKHHPTDETLWALRHVSFELPQGKVLGIIGKNGAGKSTLLKILSRVTEPTEGYAEIRGRVGSLLEVGTGFHPELTGRENIYLNGAILGMRREEIDRKFDEIVAFSEIGRFLDTPVKRYSSGMYVRLAFAVAAHLEPEILVVDEVLAVGDAAFQRKCLGRMSDVAQGGRTVLFVSHNMSAILNLTEEAIVLDKGQIVFHGPTTEAVDFYLSSAMMRSGERVWQPEEVPAAAYPFRPLALRVKDARGRATDTVRSTEPVTVEVEYALDAPLRGLRVGIYLLSMRGEYAFTSFDTDDLDLFERWETRPAGRYISRCTIPADLLNGGRYLISVNASAYGVKRYFHEDNAAAFVVDATGAPGSQWAEARPGVVRPRLAWEIEVEEQ